MTTVIENPRQRIVQESLEAVTWPGEALLGFALCRYNPGEFFDRDYYLGLTPRRFLLVRKDHPERVYSIYRSCVEKVVHTHSGLFRQPGFELHMGCDVLRLEIVSPWDQQAGEIAEQHNTWEVESPYLTAPQFLDGIADLADLGKSRCAQALLRRHMAEDPVLEIEPRAAELDSQLTQHRWSVSLTLFMLMIALLYILGRVAWGAAWAGSGILPVLLLVLAAEQLLRRQRTWRGLALGFILLAALINLAYSGVSGSLLNGVVWAAFALASGVVLTGRTGRPRNMTAAAIFAFGFLLPLAITGVVMASAPKVHFDDDFSTNKGWISRDSKTISSGIEDAAFAIHVKERGATFFAFPPVSFSPTAVVFDAHVPEPFHKKVGTFGVACGYQDADPGYLIEIDPAGRQYTFLRHVNEEYVPLNQGYWRPMTGFLAGEGAARVEVQCAQGEMTLAVNGVIQGKAAAPDLVSNGNPSGKMGLFVRTWQDTQPEGFKILFDNVVFQDGKAR